MATDYTIDDLLRLSREERCRLRVGRRRVRGRFREKRRKLSREELLDYLKRNDFRTFRQLEENRKPGDPRIWDYRQEFGSWSQAKQLAFGKPFPHEITCEYLVKVVALMDLWTRKKYEQAHIDNPDVVPSYWYVRKEFNRWATLRYCAERYDGERMLNLYVRLYRQLGHEPTAIECEEREVDRHMLEQIFGGRKMFRQIVEVMVKNAKRV